MPSPRNLSAGFSLVEILLAILILGIVITTSLFVYYERERRMVEAGELMLVWQVLGNEAEARRYASWAMQAPGPPQPFYTDLALLAQLESVVAEAAIEQVDAETRKILLRVSWRNGGREATAEVIRTDTGGDSLW
jgi:prepilin-type N-terminal cleavage/methylation domain-containing protein